MSRVIHIKQVIETRPISLYLEFQDLTESDFENIEKISRLYTKACEARFTDVLKRVIERYAETGELPTLGIAMEDFDV